MILGRSTRAATWQLTWLAIALLAAIGSGADSGDERAWVAEMDAATVADKVAIPGLEAEIERYFSALPDAVTNSLEAASSTADEGLAEQYQLMSEEASMLAEAGDLESATDIAGELVVMSESLLGDHYLTAAAHHQLAGYFYAMGVAEPAMSHFDKALTLAEGALPEGHPQTLAIMGDYASLIAAIGDMEEAAAMNGVVVTLLADSLGAAHDRTIAARYLQYQILDAAGDAAGAASVLQENCNVLDDHWSEFHRSSIDCHIELARSQVAAAQYTQGRTEYEVALAALAARSSSIDGPTLELLAEMADTWREQGDYEQANELLGRVSNTAVITGSLDALAVARSYQGRVLNNLGHYPGALTVTLDVLDYGLAHWQDSPLDIYNTMLELGVIYQRMGRLADAEATYTGAFEGLLDIVGPGHPSTLVAMNNLGQVLEEAGLYDDAEPLLLEALAGMEVVYGEANPQTARARNNLALLHESQGNFREAEPLYQRSRELLTASLGETASDTIAVSNNLAYLYMLMEDYPAAAAAFEEVHLNWVQTLGEQHQFTLKALNNRGRVMRSLGDLEQAEQLVLAALTARKDSLGDDHLDVIRSMIDLGVIFIDQQRLDEARALLAEALAKAEANLGNEHPYTFEALNNLARVEELMGNLDTALALRAEGFNRRSRFLDRMLWVAGENAREGYIRLHRPELNDYLSLLARIGGEQAGRHALAASLQRKGLLLKVTSEIQQISNLSNDPVLATTGAELEAARKQLAALTLSGPTAETQGRHAQVLYELEQKVNALQGQLGRASARYRSSIAQLSVDTLAAVMAEDTALVDFLSYESDGEQRVLAGIVTRSGGEVAFDLVEYPSREELDEMIIEFRTVIQEDETDEIEDLGIILYEMLWQPVAEVIGELNHVYLIPDGTLNILPINALQNPGEGYLLETHDLHILTSARDLLPNEYDLSQGEYVIVAGPDYDSEEVVDAAQLDLARSRSAGLSMEFRGAGSGLRGLSFAPLPGAEEEGRIITERVAENEEPSEVFFGEDAEELVLATLGEAPEILHVATHGFFLKADDNLRKRLLKVQRGAEVHVPPPGDNPLLRAGLAFAGVNNNAQFLGDIDTANDGVLTALEVLDLNLSGTRLVVLSACETGLGEIHEGEGVYGLRRSFQEAGVAEVISSLWEVNDAGTQALMTGFYDRLLTGIPARQALRESQLELMASQEWGFPQVWAAFMIVGSYESAGITVQ